MSAVPPNFAEAGDADAAGEGARPGEAAWAGDGGWAGAPIAAVAQAIKVIATMVEILCFFKNFTE